MANQYFPEWDNADVILTWASKGLEVTVEGMYEEGDDQSVGTDAIQIGLLSPLALELLQATVPIQYQEDFEIRYESFVTDVLADTDGMQILEKAYDLPNNLITQAKIAAMLEIAIEKWVAETAFTLADRFLAHMGVYPEIPITQNQIDVYKENLLKALYVPERMLEGTSIEATEDIQTKVFSKVRSRLGGMI